MPVDSTRRRFERVPFFTNVTLSPSQGLPLEGRTIDISFGGVRVVCPKPLPVGQLVTITFHLTTPSGMAAKTEQVIGRIVNLQVDVDATAMGLEFVAPLNEKSTPLLVRAIERL